MEGSAKTEGSLTTGMGEALSLVHLRLLRVYLVYALSAGASSKPGDVSVYAVFRSRLIIPFDFYFLMFTHKIWRGGLKPHPLPSRFRRSPPVENSPHDLYDEGLPTPSRTFHEPPAEPPLIPDEHCDERQDGKDHAELCELVEHRCLRRIRLRGKCRQTGTGRNLLHII